MNAIVQFASVATRFLKPVRKTMWTSSHASHPMNPESFSGPIVAIARKREIVAIVPRRLVFFAAGRFCRPILK